MLQREPGLDKIVARLEAVKKKALTNSPTLAHSFHPLRVRPQSCPTTEARYRTA
jgi:hypothetical protein